MTAVSIRNARVDLGGRTIWRDVSLDVGTGELVAILGPNGVGKSTLLKAILGLAPLAAGEISVLGRPAGVANHDIGYLPQRRSFDPSLRIRGVDIVGLGLDGDRFGISLPTRARRRERRDRIDELIDLVDAGSYARRPIGECSGGEQQRLLIAQALARRPPLLLLDEPLDSLDLPNQTSVATLVAEICGEERVAVMIVAHDVNPILTHLDRVVYLGAGGAVSGSPEAVITTETLSRLYQSPVEVLHASDGRLVVVGQPEATSYHPDLHHHPASGHHAHHGSATHGVR
ncbi:MAG: zinc/manganese transport system ATP-binding protein [Actinomycetota bacterium]|jgi:zinc/manganese transport system ATP-binding protein|nr:zinc/manganese transport system ATP-binding protein [Actinomycetota bacterium]